MKNSLSCAAQDMLEAAIVQRRRLNLKCMGADAQTISYQRVLAINIGTTDGTEYLTILTTDNEGGIIKLPINTAELLSFEANDFNDPRIQFQSSDDISCT